MNAQGTYRSPVHVGRVKSRGFVRVSRGFVRVSRDLLSGQIETLYGDEATNKSAAF